MGGFHKKGPGQKSTLLQSESFAMDTVALLFVLLVMRCGLLPSSSPMELLLIANQLSASRAASRRCFRSVMSMQEAELQTMRLHEELDAEEEVREQHVKQQKQEEVGDSSPREP